MDKEIGQFFKDKYPLFYKHRWRIAYIIIALFCLGLVFSCQASLIERSFENLGKM